MDKLQCGLRHFWTHGLLFIRESLKLQEEPKPHYNTLSTIVRILEEKGYIGYKVYGKRNLKTGKDQYNDDKKEIKQLGAIEALIASPHSRP